MGLLLGVGDWACGWWEDVGGSLCSLLELTTTSVIDLSVHHQSNPATETPEKRRVLLLVARVSHPIITSENQCLNLRFELKSEILKQISDHLLIITIWELSVVTSPTAQISDLSSNLRL